MKLRKNRGAVAEAMDELEVRLNQGMRRPMNLILATIEQIRRMRFTPENEAAIAKVLRDGMLEQGLMGLYSDAQVTDLARGLEEMRKSFAEKAIR